MHQRFHRSASWVGAASCLLAVCPTMGPVRASNDQQPPATAWNWNSAATVNVPAITPAPAGQRLLDIADHEFYDFVNNGYDYSAGYKGTAPSVLLTYDQAPAGGYFVGRIDATGLKPNFAYQLKLEGDATVDANANQLLGYAGRWWSNASGNVNDGYYQAFNGTDSGGYIKGYLMMATLVTDSQGNASWNFGGNHSNHVDWRLALGSSPTTGEQSASTLSNTATYERINTKPTPDGLRAYLEPNVSPADYYGYGSTSPYPAAPSSTTNVQLYWEHQSDGSVTVGSTTYAGSGTRPDPVNLLGQAGATSAPTTLNCNFVMTEETFHQSSSTYGGNWPTVLSVPVTFTIDPTRVGYQSSPEIGAPLVSVSVSRGKKATSGSYYYSPTASVTVTDSGTVANAASTSNVALDGSLVGGAYIGAATVTAAWTAGGKTYTVSGTTGSNGLATLTSPQLALKPGTTITFTITGVTKNNVKGGYPPYAWDGLGTSKSVSAP